MITPRTTVSPTSIRDITDWASHHGLSLEGVLALPGDLSTRRYFRCRWEGRSVIVAHYPSDALDGARRFLETTALLEAAGIPVPSVLRFDRDRGVMVLTDAGSENLYQASPRLGRSSTAEAVDTASRWISPIQGLDRDRVRELSPPLDTAALGRELEQTWRYFLHPRGLEGPGRDLPQALDDLCSNLGESELVPCHRDFMARNFLVGDGSSPALTLIDHQDLRLGPRFYDLASLLNDSLFASPENEEKLLERLVPDPVARIDYHRAVAQRTLKAIGTFCRFADCGHPQHLSLVVPTLRRAWSQLPRVPELRHLPPVLESSWRVSLQHAVSNEARTPDRS
ncbi:MAG: phosphotransferase [Thermoanaerobaculia bacterium]|nr:phosphotransferase [Thermoanaerobaculia bacterium]